MTTNAPPFDPIKQDGRDPDGSGLPAEPEPHARLGPSDGNPSRGEASSNADPTTRARPLADWAEEDGDVLWWRFPIEEPPYVGSPLDAGRTISVIVRAVGYKKQDYHHIGGWPGYHTHWTPIVEPEEPPASGMEAEGHDAQRHGAKPDSPATEGRTPDPTPVRKEA